MDSIPLDFPQKQCCTCKQWLPITSDFFVRDKSKKDGFYSKCKQCMKLYRKQYYQTHKEFVTEQNRLYTEAHKEQKSEYKKRWHTENRARMLTRMRIYSLAHRDEHNAWTRHYRQTDRGKLSRRIHEHKRRTNKRGNGGSHTSSQLQEQLKRQKNLCYYCKGKLGMQWDADHIVPLSRGGSDDISNIVIACRRCNQSKGNKLLHEWRKSGGMLL